MDTFASFLPVIDILVCRIKHHNASPTIPLIHVALIVCLESKEVRPRDSPYVMNSQFRSGVYFTMSYLSLGTSCDVHEPP